MKIVIINNLYLPFNRGGAETVVLQQVYNLVKQHHNVVVITTEPLFNPQPVKIHQSIMYKIYRFYPANIFSFYNLNKLPVILRVVWRLIDIFNLHSYFKLKSILKNEKPAIIYTHNLTGLGYLIPYLIKHLKIKNVQTIHDVALIRPTGLLIGGQEQESILIKLYFKLTRWLFNSPEKVIFPSEWIKNYYLQHKFFAKSNKQVVKNFNIEIKNLLSNKILKNSTKINFLYIGQIEKAKGILFLINVFNTLEFNNYNLQIIGTGSQLVSAKRLAINNQHIKFYGRQSSPQVKEALKQTDYLIVPSLCYENSPTVIFEALQTEVPVIASNLGGIPELIQDAINGYLFKVGDKNDLIKTLESVIIKI